MDDFLGIPLANRFSGICFAEGIMKQSMREHWLRIKRSAEAVYSDYKTQMEYSNEYVLAFGEWKDAVENLAKIRRLMRKFNKPIDDKTLQIILKESKRLKLEGADYDAFTNPYYFINCPEFKEQIEIYIP